MLLSLSLLLVVDLPRTKGLLGFPCGSNGKQLPAMQKTWVRSMGQEGPLEKGMATHSSISCLENSMDRGAWL